MNGQIIRIKIIMDDKMTITVLILELAVFLLKINYN